MVGRCEKATSQQQTEELVEGFMRVFSSALLAMATAPTQQTKPWEQTYVRSSRKSVVVTAAAAVAVAVAVVDVVTAVAFVGSRSCGSSRTKSMANGGYEPNCFLLVVDFEQRH